MFIPAEYPDPGAGHGDKLIVTRQYDRLQRLTNILSRVGNRTLSASAYQYNNVNQRIRQTTPDQSYWSYGYDSLGQVNSGKRHWPGGMAVAD